MRWLALLAFLSSFATAAVTPAEYKRLTAAEKRAWHVTRGLETPYRLGYPSTVRQLCTQVLAAPALFSRGYMERTVQGESGYPEDLWRRLFGKAVHTFGPMAPGEVRLERPLMGLPAGTYPATLRFSLANTYLPRVPGGEFRPGLVVILHRDGAEADVGIFTMPPSGLTGFSRAPNLFELTYTNFLDRPGEGILKLAAATFGLVAAEPLRQRDSVLLEPEPGWANHYAQTRSFHFGRRLAELQVPEEGAPLFTMYDYSDRTRGAAVGTISQLGRWVNSRHANAWFVKHTGFVLR